MRNHEAAVINGEIVHFQNLFQLNTDEKCGDSRGLEVAECVTHETHRLVNFSLTYINILRLHYIKRKLVLKRNYYKNLSLH